MDKLMMTSIVLGVIAFLEFIYIYVLIAENSRLKNKRFVEQQQAELDEIIKNVKEDVIEEHNHAKPNQE